MIPILKNVLYQKGFQYQIRYTIFIDKLKNLQTTNLTENALFTQGIVGIQIKLTLIISGEILSTDFLY